RPEIEAAIFTPVDQPFVPPALLRRLAQGWRMGAPLAAPVVEGALHGAPVVEGALHGAPVVDSALRGAPALFDRGLWPELMAVRGDVGGREVLRRHAATAHAIPAQTAWLRDLDTPDDFEVNLCG
ncbi:MAG: NTP transferase domain-containing protein, partial [Caldilineaceae bacterium]|nr:NTP transferase domain-containing protein [Caldilineaceae bacterium]